MFARPSTDMEMSIQTIVASVAMSATSLRRESPGTENIAARDSVVNEQMRIAGSVPRKSEPVVCAVVEYLLHGTASLGRLVVCSGCLGDENAEICCIWFQVTDLGL